MTRELAVVMPVFNEAAGIDAVIADWRATVLDAVAGSELILVDDGSTDGSAGILDGWSRKDPRIVVLHQKNGGHGAAIVAGYRAAIERGTSWVFQTDSDAQFLSSQFFLTWNARAGAMLVCGKRRRRGEPISRQVGAVIERLILSVLFGVRIPDPNCGFRLMRRDLLERAASFVRPGDFAPNVEISVIAHRFSPGGSRSVDVECRPRQFGESSLSLRGFACGTLRTFRDLIALRERLRTSQP